MDLRTHQEETQTRVFTRWMNMHLKRHGHPEIDDLIQTVSEGKVLLKLLGFLTGEHVSIPNKSPKLRVHFVENCSAVIRFVSGQEYVDHKKKTVKIKLTNISGRDLVDKKKNLILGLMFTIILRLQISDAEDVIVGKEGLLIWCQKAVKDYDDVKIKNLHKSFSGGLALAAIVHRYRPDLIDYDEVKNLEPEERVKAAFDAASKAGIEQLLDTGDLLIDKPDEKSVYTQVLQYFLVFTSGAQAEQAGERLNDFISILRSLNEMNNEYEEAAAEFKAWCSGADKNIAGLQVFDTLTTCRQSFSNLQKWRATEKSENQKEYSHCKRLYHKIQGFLFKNRLPPYEAPEAYTPEQLAKSWSSVNLADSTTGKAILTAITEAENKLKRSFADAAESFDTWTDSPRSQIEQINKATNEPSSDRLEKAKAVRELIETEGTPLFDQCSSTQAILDEHNLFSNELTSFTFNGVQLQWSALQETSTELINKLTVLVETDTLCQAFADAAEEFVAWAASPQEKLQNITKSSEDAVTRLAQAEELVEMIITEGTPLYETATSTQAKIDEAGISSNNFTTQNLGMLAVTWESLTDMAETTRARLALLAENDKLRVAYATAAESFISYLDDPRSKLSSIISSSESSQQKSDDASALSSSVVEQGTPLFEATTQATEACTAAGITQNPYTVYTQANLNVQWKNLNTDIAKAVSQLSSAAENEELCQTYASAAEAVTAFLSEQRTALTAAITSEEANEVSEKLESSTVLNEAETAQNAVNDAGILENLFTVTTYKTLALDYSNAKNEASVRAQVLSTSVTEKQLCRNFSNACSEFFDWSESKQAAVSDNSGELDVRLSALEEISSTLESESNPLLEAVTAAGTALTDAGVTRNPFTTSTIADVSLDLDDLTNLIADKINSLKEAVTEQERLRVLGAENLAEINKIFLTFDKDRCGALEINEFIGALKALGHSYTDEKAYELFSSLDTDQSGSVDKGEFIAFMSSLSQADNNEDTINQAFATIAGEGNTHISEEQLAKALAPETLEYIKANVSPDENGLYDYRGWSSTLFANATTETSTS